MPVAVLVVTVDLAEGAEPLDLNSLAGIILPDKVTAGEGNALVTTKERLRRPPLTITLQSEEECGDARGSELVASGDVLNVRENSSELTITCAAKLTRGTPGGVIFTECLLVDGGGDRGGVTELVQHSGNADAWNSAGIACADGDEEKNSDW